jgi:uncharacterized membrane protein HdeD (DUF308 family)
MKTKSYKNWWFLALNGMIAVLFGILLTFFPQKVIETIVSLIGIGLLIVGAIQLIAGIYNIKKDKAAGMILSESILFLAMGLALLIISTETAMKIIFILFGIWAIIIGIIQLVIIINVKGPLSNKNLLLFNSLLTIVVGIIMFFKPLEWAAFLIVLIGIFIILFGILLIYFSFILRSVNTQGDSVSNNNSGSKPKD